MSDHLSCCVGLIATGDMNLINTTGQTLDVVLWLLSDCIPFFWQKAVLWNAVTRCGSDFTDNYKKDPNNRMPDSPLSWSTLLKAGVTELCCHVMRIDKPRKIRKSYCILSRKRKGIY